MQAAIDAQISQVTGRSFATRDRRSVSGGCINQGQQISDGERSFFVKSNRATAIDMFEAEALALQQMHQTQTILVPNPICWGVADGSAYLVQEWLEFGSGNARSWAELGRDLARLHQVRQSTAFGWERDNTIGATPQMNPWTANWSEFFTQHRLLFQFQSAQQRGGSFPKQAKVLDAIASILSNHHPQPSFVHGDLWSGNAAITTDGTPVIFDPAAYWGDREVDLAMSELFGGFPPQFYQGYDEVFSIDSGYAQRKTIYNLYHILNHFNLFGGGSYASQSNRMIDQILAS